MHFRRSCATILVIFLPLKRFCNAQSHNVPHNQLSARVDSTSAFPQVNFSVVVHGRMQDLPRGQLFWGLEMRDVAKRLLGGFGGMLPLINFLEWCVLEHIFINFSLSKSLKIFIFYTKIMINCSHVLARGSRSMIHCPQFIIYLIQFRLQFFY